MPGAEWLEPRGLGVVVPRLDLDVRTCTVSDLLMGVEDRLLGARMGRDCKTDGHALREERAVVRAREKVTPAAPHDAVPRRHGRKDVPQGPAARPPELVGIRVDDPVGAVLGRGEPRHPRHPLVLAHVVARLAEQPQATCALVPLEDLRRPVVRCVVRGDDEIDAGVQVVRDLRIDDVCLVAGEQRHDDPHGRLPPRPSATASTTRSAARPSTTPTTCSTARRRSLASSSGCSSARSIPATTSSKRPAR